MISKIIYILGSHDGSVQSSTAGTYGSANDKTLIRFDEDIDAFRTLPIYTKLGFDLFINATETVRQEGVYVIVDGGYHHWVSTIKA